MTAKSQTPPEEIAQQEEIVKSLEGAGVKDAGEKYGETAKATGRLPNQTQQRQGDAGKRCAANWMRPIARRRIWGAIACARGSPVGGRYGDARDQEAKESLESIAAADEAQEPRKRSKVRRSSRLPMVEYGVQGAYQGLSELERKQPRITERWPYSSRMSKMTALIMSGRRGKLMKSPALQAASVRFRA